MIRVAMDTDNLADLDGRFPILLTYADLVPSLSELQGKFPRSEVVLIDRGTGDPEGLSSVIDVEQHAEGIAAAPGWYDRQHARGIPFLTTYCSRDTLPALDAAMGAREHFRWVATLDGTAFIAGMEPTHRPALVQVLGEAQLGVHADLSLVWEANWHPQPGPGQLGAVRQDVLSARHFLAQTGHALDDALAKLPALG